MPWAIFVLGLLACVPGLVMLVAIAVAQGIDLGAGSAIVFGLVPLLMYAVPLAVVLAVVLAVAWAFTRRRRGDYVAIGVLTSLVGLAMAWLCPAALFSGST